MKQNFNICLERLLKDEGGYTNNPKDPGGPTNFGITLADYKAYVKQDATAEDVKEMDVAVAKDIYRSKYWHAINGDQLPSGVDYSIFDYAVNSGIARVRPYVALVGKLSSVDLINKINNERIDFLRHLPTWDTFGRGWSRRVLGVKAFSLQLAQKPSIGIEHGTAGTVIATGAAVTASYPHLAIYVLPAAAAIAVVTYFIVKYIKGKTNV